MNAHDLTADAPDTDAPLPWSGTEPHTTDSPGQTWRPKQLELKFLEMKYSPSADDRWRCHSRKTWTRPDAIPTIFGLGWGWFVLNDWGKYLLGMLLTGHVVRPKLSLILSPLIWALPTLTLVLLAQFILSAVHLYKTRTAPQSLYCLEVTTERITHTSPLKTSDFSWEKLRHITIHNGDIFIHSIGLDSAVYIPRTAFPSTESAKRFRAALIALWKSQGNPDMIPDEVRAEFAPQA